MTATGLAMQMRLFLSQLAKQHPRRLLECSAPTRGIRRSEGIAVWCAHPNEPVVCH